MKNLKTLTTRIVIFLLDCHSYKERTQFTFEMKGIFTKFNAEFVFRVIGHVSMYVTLFIASKLINYVLVHNMSTVKHDFILYVKTFLILCDYRKQ